MRQLLVVAFVALLTAACAEESSGIAEPDLDGHTFVSTEVAGRELVRGSHVELSFGDDVLTVHAGCNESQGVYAIDGGRIELDEDQTFTTTGYCLGPDHPMSQERWVRAFLADQPVVDLADGSLTLTRGDDVIRFRTQA